MKVISLVSQPTDGLNGAPPPAGYAFMAFTIAVTRTVPEPLPANFITVRLLGPSKVERTEGSSPKCYGDNSNGAEVHQGGTATTGGCISVLTSDVGDLVLRAGSEKPIWFATK